MRNLNGRSLSALVVALGAAACGGGSDSASIPLPGGPAGADANTFLSIVPPGSNGNSSGGIGAPAGFPIEATQYPANFRDQLDMYGNLAYAQSPLKADTCTPPASIAEHVASSDQACNYFKRANLTLDPASAVSTRTLAAPNGKNVTIRRDGWGVPYVDGEDRGSAEFGLGFAAAQDRLWLFDVLRNAGRGRASEMLGPAPTTFDLDLEFGAPAGYSEDEITDIVNAAVAKIGSPLGPMFLNDVQMFVAGMNEFIAYLQGEGFAEIPPEYGTLALGVPPKFPPPPFTVNDIVANAILIQSALGLGGGGEASNVNLLQKLDPSIGPATTTLPQAACEMWRDLRHATAPDTPVTATGTFATQSPPTLNEDCPQALPAGVALWDRGSFTGRTLLTHGGGSIPLPIPGLPKTRAPQPATASAIQKLGRLNLSLAPPLAMAAEVRPPLRATLGGTTLAATENLGASLHATLNRLGLPLTTSNFIAVAASETKSGHPIMVAGPQTGYFNPQLLWEAAVVSRGGTPFEIAARGISTVNLPYLVIGHGLDFAWSPTSAGSDFTDTRVSRLCNVNGTPALREDLNADGFPDADGYLFKGACVRFYKRIDQWTATPTPASVALGGPTNAETVRRFILRTHYGPVFATATVNGAPVAISTQRSTFFADVDTAAPFALLTTTGLNMDQARFKKLFNSMTATFNWLYADKHDIAFIQSGLYPLRHPQHDPQLPVWGDGNFEWVADQGLGPGFFTSFGGDGNAGAKGFPSRAVPVVQDSQGYMEWPGFIPLSAHIQDTNPPTGYLANWNNSGARGWWAADSNGTYGPTHRVENLRQRLAAFKASGRKHDLGTMIETMGDAAYTDLRGMDVLPLLLQLMQAGTLSPDQQSVVALMQQWIAEGSNKWISNTPGLGALRRDRDAEGTYDFRAQVILMDAWYEHLMANVTPQLAAIEALGASTLTGRYDAPRAQGSAFQEGWFQHMKRMLQMVLDTPGHASYRVLKCAGTGVPADCRAAVLTSLDQALADLGGLAAKDSWTGAAARFADCPSSPVPFPPSSGCAVEEYDSVRHTSFSFLPVPPIHWINRPTFQQAVEVRKVRNEP